MVKSSGTVQIFSTGTLRSYNMMNEMKRPDIPEFFG
jgi:hypothetical protein